MPIVTLLLAGGLASGHAQTALTDVPPYTPTEHVSGTLRIAGGDFSGLLQHWEQGFQNYQPAVKFQDNVAGSDIATASLMTGTADIGSSGREPALVELEAFHDSTGTDLVQVTVATGTLDVKGSTWTPVVLVNADNPIQGLTMRQLDGIFGAERTGGYEAYHWMPEAGRGSNSDIRTWSQLGLGGEWTGKPIQTLGYAPFGVTSFFQHAVMGGGSKFNPNYREYVEAGSKLIAPTAGGAALGTDHMYAAVSADKFAIAWGGLRQSRDFPRLRVLPLAAKDGGPYVAPTRQTLQNRAYPLARSIYMFVRADKTGKLQGPVREFLTYVLSMQGQGDVAASNTYLPLTAELAGEQRHKLR